MRYKYRISKYNPRYRNVVGFYEKEEWTHFGQVGTKIDGRVLTRKRYQRVEKAYLDTIRDLLRESMVSRLQIARLRLIGNMSPTIKTLRQKQWVDIATVIKLCRLSLREQLEVDLRVPRRVYLHFGSDFYVYVGLPTAIPNAIARAEKRGIYIEDKASPYRER
jgi:hypothetical protein